MREKHKTTKVLVTGATGYIGGRLITRLLDRGYQVRILVRDRRRVEGRTWADRVEVRVGDLLDSSSLDGVFEGVDAAYYLVHSMESGSSFEERDRIAAENFAAHASSVDRVIYLGGLLPKDARSTHLASRAEVGQILRASLPTLEFRAGPIIGSGSASFEMVRYLTERLPAMVAPKWISNEVQSIAISDILEYLIAGLESDATGIIEVGTDRHSFKKMMQIYAEVRGLKRIIVPIPVLAPKLAGLWVGLVTPIMNRIAVPLIEGIVSSVLADTQRATTLFPDIRPLSYREAVRLAVRQTFEGKTETRWSGALGTGATYEIEEREGLIREVRSIPVEASSADVYAAFSSVGGERGWMVWDAVWKVRGLIDRLFGGPGLRRGRRHPSDLLVGEALDFWRVEAIEPDHLLRLRAEMKVPGRAWLQWEAVPEGKQTRLVQTATFVPSGLLGVIYWYLLYPAHKIIFSDLAKAIVKAALRTSKADKSSGDSSPIAEIPLRLSDDGQEFGTIRS